MRLSSDGTLRLSPSDLANHLACEHLTQLELRVMRGEIERPFLEDPYGGVIRRKGTEHERAYLARLEAEGRRIARMPVYEDEGFDSAEARRLTAESIRVQALNQYDIRGADREQIFLFGPDNQTELQGDVAIGAQVEPGAQLYLRPRTAGGG